MKRTILRFSGFVLFVWLLGGCSEQLENPFQSPLLEKSPGITVAIEQLQSVMDIQDQATGVLFRNPEVVGTGTGADENGNAVIVVYTLTRVEQRKDVTLKNVGTGQNPTALPVSIENVPVVPKVTGMFKAYVDPTLRYRPAPIGVSTGHPDITAGTIGCRVKDASGKLYALSNNHVYANVNEATIGDNVLQPGAYDGGTDPADVIGTLYDFEPISFSSDNTMDAAIALVTSDMVGTATLSDGYGTPGTQPIAPAVNLSVKKYGRTTRYTFGQIEAVNVTVDVCYESRGPFRCVKAARFVNQVSITPGTFSDGGDSGSLIVTGDGNNNPVALLFAGSSASTIGTPIGVVLERFGVAVDNGGGGTVTYYDPVADFTYTTSGLTVNFTDKSYDPDGGSITAWSWGLGDGGTSTAQNPSYTYGASGIYTVTLTVTDDEGATGSTSQNVTVSDGSASGITLTATGYKVRGTKYTDLTWDGATGTVDIYRDGVIIATDPDGAYTDSSLGKGGGTYVYRVCETGTSTCSNEVTVTF